MQTRKRGNNGRICNAHLRVLSKTYDLGEGVDERIRNQVVQGCFSHELRKSFLKTETLTLNGILKKAKAVELSEGQIRQMKREGKEDEKVFMIHKKKKNSAKGQSSTSSSGFRDNSGFNNRNSSDRSQNRQFSSNSKSLKCFRCDREGDMAKSESCPARNKKCKSCSKLGHFAIVCRSKTKISAVRTGEQLSGRNNTSRVGDNSSSEEDVWQISHKVKPSNETSVSR